MAADWLDWVALDVALEVGRASVLEWADLVEVVLAGKELVDF